MPTRYVGSSNARAIARPGLVVVLVAVFMALASTDAWGVNILTIGNSITYGYSRINPPSTYGAIGYQLTLGDILNDQLGITANFVGEYEDFADFDRVPWDPSRDLNTNPHPSLPGSYTHFGLPSATTAGIHDALLDVPIPNVDNGDESVYWDRSGQTLGERMTTPPDLIIMHVAINDIARTTAMSSGAIDTLVGEYSDMLADIASQFATAEVLVDLIMPKLDFASDGEIARNNSAAFNADLQDLIESIMTGTNSDPALDSLTGRINYANMQTLSITELAGVGMSLSLQALAQDDADDWVDWARANDESALVDSDISGRNGDLYSDFVHPTGDGYDVMAWGIYNGLVNSGFDSIPEPGALLLLCGGGLLILMPNRR